MRYRSSRRNNGRKFLTKYKKSRRTSIISHVNIIESNNLKTSNMGNVKITSNYTYQTIQNGSSSNPLITLSKIIDTESNVFINDEIPVSNDTTEDN